ncbi:MAG: pilin [bacterium]|nr:pilin [bacterium]
MKNLLVKPVFADDIFGEIDPVGGGKTYGEVTSGSGGLDSPINFINNILSLLTVAAGIWFLITIITSGVKIINQGRDPKAFAEAMKRILWSALGLALVAFAYMISGWIGQQFFGDANYIVNPTIK